MRTKIQGYKISPYIFNGVKDQPILIMPVHAHLLALIRAVWCFGLLHQEKTLYLNSIMLMDIQASEKSNANLKIS